MSAETRDQELARTLRAAAFSAIAAYIIASPFLVQIAGLNLPFIRPWIMFKEVGVGVLKGEFEFTSKDGSVARLSPLEVLGLDRYPVHAQTYRFKKLVFEDAHIERVVADFCGQRRGDYAGLSFRGRVGAGPAWRPLTADDLCKGGAE